ncbi:hypothetical protein Tco_1040944 [Tanacetum coccineum]|uniref:Uncharacterized protein n=1 Tax=Tanacetum coccineum TaxID=301880 RepID=A0ABQ5GFM9_9ASTR
MIVGGRIRDVKQQSRMTHVINCNQSDHPPSGILVQLAGVGWKTRCELINFIINACTLRSCLVNDVPCLLQFILLQRSFATRVDSLKHRFHFGRLGVWMVIALMSPIA